MTTSKIQKRITSFDGLRAIAIFLVIIGHAQHTIKTDSTIWDFSSIFLANSSLGVRLFFVLSGYLITQLILQEIQKKGFIKLKDFHFKRAIRIFPAFYCFILIVFLLNFIVNLNITSEQFLAAISFTWNYKGLWHEGSAEGNWFLGHLWTLSLEAQFYLLWPLILVFIGIKNSQKLSLVIILILPFVRVASYFLFPEQRGYLGMMLHTAIDSIMVGCLIAIIAQSPTYRKRISSINGLFIAMITIWIFLISPLVGHWIRGYGISIGITLDAIASGILIAWLHVHPLSYLSKFLSNRVFVYIGQISYSLYLWQQLFLTDYNHTISGVFPYNILFSFLVALLSYYLVEKPCLSLKNLSVNLKKES